MKSIQNNPVKISVVIPTYKRTDLLLRCLHALTSQEFPAPDYEIIVVSDGYDGATFDAVAPLTRKPGPAVHLHYLKKKGGPAAARNKGWQYGLGELIAFTDDDCIPDKSWLNEMWQAYIESKMKAVAFTGKTKVPISEVPTDYERNIAQLENAEFITANCAVSKTALLFTGGFDEAFTMAWREDSDFQFRLMKKNIPIIPVQEAIVIHPVRKAPWGVSIKEEKKGIFNALLFKKHPELYKQKIQPSPPWHYYAIVFFLVVALAGLMQGQRLISLTGLVGWLAITLWLTIKRLTWTSHSIVHITEMFLTSIIIPFLSLYYRFYGSVKYKVLLIP